MAFVSGESTSSTNNVSTAYSVSSPSVSKSQQEGSSSYTNSVSSPSVSKSQQEGSSSYTDEVIHSFFSNQSSAPQLDYDDLEQINDDDMEEMNLKWQVAMISTRIKKFHKRTGKKDCKAKGNQDSRRRDAWYNGNKARDNSRRPAYQEDSNALVTIDGEDIDWPGHVEEDAKNYSMMAYSNSGTDNESVFMNKESDLEDTHVNDRYADGMHAVPPPMTGNYMPFGPDVDMNYSKFTYGPKQPSADESDSKPSEYASCESDSNVEPSPSVPEPVENESQVVCEPKVWTDAPIIEEYESDSDDDSVSNVQEEKEKPSFTFTNSVKHDDPHKDLKDKGIIDSRCSKHMTWNKAHIADYQEFKGGSVAFGGSNRSITGKGKIKTRRLDFKDVYYMEDLKHYNLFSVSQIYDKKNKVLFTDTGCLVLSLDFELLDENQKGKQHKASCKAKTVSSVNQPLQILHMDLFGHTSDEITQILQDFIRQAENQFNHKVKTIKSDNGTEFKNSKLIELCELKGIKREYINARTPQQNGVAERKNMTLIEAARTSLADSFLPTTFWAEAVNTDCYVLNRFDGKFDSGFLVGYSLNSKAFRVYNLETKRVKENRHVNFLENKPNVAGKRHAWLFDLDYLTNSMNYEPVSIENQANKSVGPKEANNSAGTQVIDDQGANSEEIDLNEEHFVLSIWSTYLTTVKSSRDKIEKNENPVSQVEQVFLKELENFKRHKKEANYAVESLRNEATHDTQNAKTSSTNLLNTASTPLSTAGPCSVLDHDW
nr:hypothetical protein [Tanacetum cinerariifolium]